MFRLWKDGIVSKEEVMVKANSPDDLATAFASAERGMADEDEENERQRNRRGQAERKRSDERSEYAIAATQLAS